MRVSDVCPICDQRVEVRNDGTLETHRDRINTICCAEGCSKEELERDLQEVDEKFGAAIRRGEFDAELEKP